MRNNFTLKWSEPKNADEHCNRTVTQDGNWKIAKTKCYYDQMTIETRAHTTWLYPKILKWQIMPSFLEKRFTFGIMLMSKKSKLQKVSFLFDIRIMTKSQNVQKVFFI